MATVYGENYTLINAGKLPTGDYGVGVHAVVDTYTCASTAVDTVIVMGKVPKGARVLGFLLYHNALGASVGFHVYCGGSNPSMSFTATSGSRGDLLVSQVGTYSPMQSETDVTLTVKTNAATGKIQLTTLYIPE